MSDLPESGRHVVELGVQYKTHGDQVTVEICPAEHVDEEHQHLGDVEQGPDGFQVIHRLGHEHPLVVDGDPVFADGAVPVGHELVTVREVRAHDPDDERRVAAHA